MIWKPRMSLRGGAHRSWLLTFAILFSFLNCATQLRAQQQYPGLAEPQETTTEVRGTIVSFAPQNGTLVIETENGKQLTLGIDEHTAIMSAPDPGSNVEVTYAEAGGKNMARTVVNPAAMLQMEHPTDKIHLLPIVLLALLVVLIAVVLQQWRAKQRRE
jgi:hypothetical protein